MTTTTAVPILIVDDRPGNLLVLESVLDSPNYHLVMVQSAQEALQALLTTDFAAVLLDVKMPDMTGYDLARLIHGRKMNRRCPSSSFPDTVRIRRMCGLATKPAV